jgi:hypothetical protein
MFKPSFTNDSTFEIDESLLMNMTARPVIPKKQTKINQSFTISTKTLYEKNIVRMHNANQIKKEN